jgi:hypothetical protein
MGHNWGSYPQAIHRVIPGENRVFRAETGPFPAETGPFAGDPSAKIDRAPDGTQGSREEVMRAARRRYVKATSPARTRPAAFARYILVL